MTRLIALAAMLILFCTPAVQAITWSGGHPTSSDWDAFELIGGNPRFTNWGGGPFNPPINVPVEFGNQYAAGTFASGVPNLNGSRVVTSLTIDHTGGQTILIGGVGDVLQIQSGNLSRLSTSTGIHTISASIVLAQPGTWAIDGSGRLEIDGVISGFGFTKNGAATLRLEGADANIYAGSTTIADGTLRLAKADNVVAIPGDLFIGDATVNYTIGSGEQIADTATVSMNNAGGLFDLNGETETIATLNLSDGTVQLGGGVLNVTDLNALGGSILLQGGALDTDTLDAMTPIDFGSGGSLTVSSGISAGVLSGSGDLTKQGAGTLTLQMANTLAGTAMIDDGQVLIEDGAALDQMDVVINVDNGLTTSVGASNYTLNSLTANALHDNGARTLTVAQGVTINSGGSLDLNTGSVLNVNSDAGILVDGGTLLRDDTSTINLNGAVKTILAVNGGTLDYTGATTIGAGIVYDLQSSSKLLSRANLTVDGGSVLLDGATLNAGGGGASTAGYDIVIDGGAINATGASLITTVGAQNEAGGSITVTSGSLNLGPSATLSTLGGAATSGHPPKLPGSVSFAAGASSLEGTLVLFGGDGPDGSNPGTGRQGADFTVSGTADVSMTGVLSMYGGAGGTVFTSDGPRHVRGCGGHGGRGLRVGRRARDQFEHHRRLERW